MAIEVIDNAERRRYEVRTDGGVIGWAAYQRDGERTTLTHTVVDPDHEGQGIGSALARHALDEIRSAGGSVVPHCPFMAAWIDRHPDYADLVRADRH